MVRYLSGDELKSTKIIDGVTVFMKGCFNCKNITKKSKVSGTCPYVRVDVWKDWTCKNHDPINPINK